MFPTTRTRSTWLALVALWLGGCVPSPDSKSAPSRTEESTPDGGGSGP
jgi:hypothetical protein